MDNKTGFKFRGIILLIKNKRLNAVWEAIPKDHEMKSTSMVLFSLLDNFSEKDKTAEETLSYLKSYLEGDKAKEKKEQTTAAASTRLKAYLVEKDTKEEEKKSAAKKPVKMAQAVEDLDALFND